MKNLFLAAAFLSFAPTMARAQVEGGVPGAYDMSEVKGWIAAPDIATADTPSWFLATYGGQISSSRTNCNIQTVSSPFSADQVVSAMLDIDSDDFLASLRQGGGDVSEIGPIWELNADGNRAIRYVARSVHQDISLTHMSAQHVAGDKLVTTTCSALEAAYGTHVPAIERFVDDVRYVNPNAVNNFSRKEGPTPLLRAGGDTNETAAFAADAVRQGIDASIAFQYRGESH